MDTAIMSEKTHEEICMAVTTWALDCVRAAKERPWMMKILLRFVLGRYAYREWVGMVNVMKKLHNPTLEYGLEKMDYHKEHQPLQWWNYLE